MHHKIGNKWIEYRQPIDLLDRPSNMKKELCWHQNNNGLMWTYDFMDHLMIEIAHHCISYNDLHWRNKFV
jgi:hypothetical protein